MAISNFFSGSEPIPRTYEEAFNLSYKLVNDSPKKAIKIIKAIYNQNQAVQESDIFYVNSIASLALRPIYRKNKIGKNLLQKVIAIKPNDLTSNSLLFALALDENNLVDALKYGNNLLNADYRKHIEELQPTLRSSIPEIRNSIKFVADRFFNIGNIFANKNEHTKAIKGYEIAYEIDPFVVEAHHNIGISLYKLKHYSEAIKYFEIDKVLIEAKIKEDPTFKEDGNEFLSRVFFNIGKSYFRLNQLTECKQSLGESIALKDKHENIDEEINEFIAIFSHYSEL